MIRVMDTRYAKCSRCAVLCILCSFLIVESMVVLFFENPSVAVRSETSRALFRSQLMYSVCIEN